MIKASPISVQLTGAAHGQNLECALDLVVDMALERRAYYVMACMMLQSRTVAIKVFSCIALLCVVL